MGIFNAISGTPTSANPHGSTTILWYSQTHAFVTTKDWLNYLQVKRNQSGCILTQPEAIIHCFFFSLYFCTRHELENMVFTPCYPFVLVSYGDSSEYCQLSSFQKAIHLLPDLGHLSFRVVCFILWKMGLSTCDGVYPILWLTTWCYLICPGVLSPTQGRLSIG